MKAIYLDGRQGIDIMLDGPALRVRSTGRADGRYPLSRISRIVTVGKVRWRPHALLACLHHKVPIAVLDNQGRFIRLRFSVVSGERGLARHIGELLGMPRYQSRYQRWLKMAEMREMESVACRNGLTGCHSNYERLWQIMISEQTALSPCPRPGKYYAYLRGLAMAHIVSLYSRIGLPAQIGMWSKQEYQLLNDIVRLEQWQHVDIVNRCISCSDERQIRRALTEAFEAQSTAREQRLAAWRQGLLLELMGVRIDGRSVQGAAIHSRLDDPHISSLKIAQVCDKALEAVGCNIGLLPIARRDSLRTSVKMLKSWLWCGQNI